MTELHDTPGFAAEQDIAVPEGLESRLSALIDKLAADEQARQSHKQRRLWQWAGGMTIAASFAAAAFFILTPSQGGHVIEVNDPEEARAQTEYALNMLSSTLAKGVAGVQQAEHTTAHIMGQLNR